MHISFLLDPKKFGSGGQGTAVHSQLKSNDRALLEIVTNCIANGHFSHNKGGSQTLAIALAIGHVKHEL